MSLDYVLNGRTLSVYKDRKLVTSGTVYNKRHVNLIKRKFDAWAKLGWPYVPEDERK